MSETGDAAPLLVRDGALRQTDGWVLVGSKAAGSDHICFPPQPLCPESLSADVELVDLPTSGTLFAHTTVHMRTAHFSPPYQVGYVDLDKGGPRIFAPLEGKGLRIGQRMRLSVKAMWEDDGQPVIAYSFVPDEETHDA